MSGVEALKERLSRRDYAVSVIGLGYVGVPEHRASSPVQALIAAHRFEATTELDRLSEPDAVIVCRGSSPGSGPRRRIAPCIDGPPAFPSPRRSGGCSRSTRARRREEVTTGEADVRTPVLRARTAR